MRACMQVNCHNASANTFVALVGDSQADFKYYGPPELYEHYVGNAPVLSSSIASLVIECLHEIVEWHGIVIRLE